MARRTLSLSAPLPASSAFRSPPCGCYGDLKRGRRCPPRQIENYRQRISGPLLDQKPWFSRF
ncbi:ATP-binding protein [Luteolibacter yonseiensis]|uniref:ATP-binding protein n=1 Tax=Luteolibacter yonseiensis TaxID=1144680 RepID=A0A934VAZ9_9BACT|nr:ATP-binding protein [Luteolibacter yonseiensis]MBK1815645.1 ATP-binding protein [Luteolibacter yonseiensis]